MCTILFLRRPDHKWPLILGSNRDEMSDRKWLPPARHWPDRENVFAGLDELAGGSWLGVNDEGVVAGILNRKGTLGPKKNFRSRGELVLEALDHGDAVDAVKAISDLNPSAYRSFNLFIADNRDAWWIRNTEFGVERVETFEIPIGFSMLTAWGLNSSDSARTEYFLPKLRVAKTPNPETCEWTSWKKILNCKDFAPGTGSGEAMLIDVKQGFGTISSTLIALETAEVYKPRKKWLFLDRSSKQPKFTSFNL
jgi:hypothetical protein